MTISPDSTLKASKDLHFIGDTLVRISRALHEQTRKLKTAVEGTYASERGDPRLQLLSNALSVSRTADLELGRVNLAAKRVLLALQEQFSTGQQASVPTITPPAQPTASVIPEHEREALTTSITNLERKRSELETLYEIAQDLNSTLEFDDVLRLAMDKVISVVGAERGFIVLVNPETGSIEFKIARDKQARAIGKGAFEISQSTLDRVVKTRKPMLSDSTYDPTKSMMAYDIRSIMCAPLLVRGNCIGAVYVDSRLYASLFNEKTLDLLLAFCNQAAIAIDNARLFSKVNEDKQYMDNIFASMANGVITTNSAGIITTFNLAASYILGLDPAQVVGKPTRKSLRRCHRFAWPNSCKMLPCSTRMARLSPIRSIVLFQVVARSTWTCMSPPCAIKRREPPSAWRLSLMTVLISSAPRPRQRKFATSLGATCIPASSTGLLLIRRP